MNGKIGIIIVGIIAALISVNVAELIYGFTEGIILGRLIAIVISIVTTGILYALTYAYTNGRHGELAGLAGGIFAGAVGGILTWAIGEAFFGPFELTGLLWVALIGGFLFSAQIDPQHI